MPFVCPIRYSGVITALSPCGVIAVPMAVRRSREIGAVKRLTLPLSLFSEAGPYSAPSSSGHTAVAGTFVPMEVTLSEVLNWHITGEWFDNCSCAVACPCTFAQAPDNGFCESVLF